MTCPLSLLHLGGNLHTDYAKRISLGHSDGERVTNSALQQLAGAPVMFSQCPDANVSVCAATSGSEPLVLVVYNPLAQARVVPLRVPVSQALALAGVGVVAGNGSTLASEVVRSDPYDVGECRWTLRGVVSCP